MHNIAINIKTISIAILVISTMIITSVAPVRAEPVAFWIAQEHDSVLDSWLWATEMKKLYTDFDINNTSYIVTRARLMSDYRYSYPVNYNVKWAEYEIYYVLNDAKITASISDYSTFGDTLHLAPTKYNYIKHAKIKVNSPKVGFPSGEFQNGMSVQALTDITTPVPFPILSTIQYDNAATTEYITTQSNLNYAPSFVEKSLQFTQHLNETEYTLAVEVKCDTLDIMCYAKKIFIPDENTLKAKYDSFHDFMVLKLGFLTYPSEFLGDLFASFDTTQNSCNETACTKNFGELLGGDFSLDFLAMKNTAPTMWTWFKTLIVGVTLFELVIMLKRKYMDVVRG